MKIRKPDDEKFFKDIVLNDILGEISNENEERPDTVYQEKETSSVKNTFSAKRLFIVGMGIALLLFIIILFNLRTETKTVEQHIPEKLTIDKQEWKMEKDREGYKDKKESKEKLPIKVVEKKVILKKEVLRKPAIIAPIPIQKTQRELAKEALRQQMLN